MDEVIVVGAGRIALSDYEQWSTYFCQPGRSHRPTSHIAFYSKNMIHPVVPAITEAIPSVICSEAAVRALPGLSSESRGRLLAMVQLLGQARSPRLGQPQGVMLLTPPSDPRTIHLKQPIVNVLTTDTGRRRAFTQGPRYVSLEALRRSPATTAELLGMGGVEFLGAPSREGLAQPVARLPAAPAVTVSDPTIVPPFDGAAEHLARIRSSRGLPERNMEDLVKDLLIRLGHPTESIVFQVGRIDVLVQASDGKPHIVVEVKASLRSRPNRDSALRQAFDYAGRNGAPIVVISDADSYEIYDRRAGLDHASMLQASFRLTAFRDADVLGLGLLRPPA